MRLGIDCYSVRDQGWDAFQMMDFAARLHLDAVHFSERGYLTSLEAGYLRRVRAYAEERGLAIEVGMGSFDRYSASFKPGLGSGEVQLGAMIDAAVVLGSRVVRCFLGTEVDRHSSVPLERHIAECIRTLQAISGKVQDTGVRIAVENHGGVDLLARELRALIETVGFDTVGVCLDTGNPVYGGEDPLVSAEVLAPYVLTSHVRDSRVWMTPDGAQVQWVPLGDGNVDLAAIVAVIEKHHPEAPIDLEIITGRPPKALDYHHPQGTFWQIYPQMLARDFVRFLQMAGKGKGEPLQQMTVEWGHTLSEENRLVFQRQQIEHFERSVRFAREQLRLGGRR